MKRILIASLVSLTALLATSCTTYVEGRARTSGGYSRPSSHHHHHSSGTNVNANIGASLGL